MKKKIPILIMIALMATLLASSVVSARSNSIGAVPALTAQGGRYYLSIASWQVSGSMHGAGYTLQGPAGPALTGNGCCCTFLPCVRKP